MVAKAIELDNELHREHQYRARTTKTTTTTTNTSKTSRSEAGKKGAQAAAKTKGATCSHCHIGGHTSDQCWKKHPELRPSKNKRKRDTDKDHDNGKVKKEKGKNGKSTKHVANVSEAESSEDEESGSESGVNNIQEMFDEYFEKESTTIKTGAKAPAPTERTSTAAGKGRPGLGKTTKEIETQTDPVEVTLAPSLDVRYHERVHNDLHKTCKYVN